MIQAAYVAATESLMVLEEMGLISDMAMNFSYIASILTKIPNSMAYLRIMAQEAQAKKDST